MDPSLPPELYVLVFSYLSPPDLIAVARTNRALYPIAESVLYRSIHCTSDIHADDLCGRLMFVPRLGPLVRHLQLYIYYGSLRSVHKPSPYVLRAALSRLPNLITLHIYSSSLSPNPSAWSLPNATPPPFELSELTVPFAIDDDLLAFLATQLTLRTLIRPKQPASHLSDTSIDPIAASILPSLNVLEADSVSFALALLCNRPITHLRVPPPSHPTFTHPQVEIDPNLLSAIASSNAKGGLRSFYMDFPHSKDDLVRCLDTIFTYAPNLRTIGCLEPLASKDSEIILALSHFDSLKTLIFSRPISIGVQYSLPDLLPSVRTVACITCPRGFDFNYLNPNYHRAPEAVHDPEDTIWREMRAVCEQNDLNQGYHLLSFPFPTWRTTLMSVYLSVSTASLASAACLNNAFSRFIVRSFNRFQYASCLDDALRRFQTSLSRLFLLPLTTTAMFGRMVWGSYGGFSNVLFRLCSYLVLPRFIVQNIRGSGSLGASQGLMTKLSD